MSRAQKAKRRGTKVGPSGELGAGSARPNPSVVKRTGLERPDTPTDSSTLPADSKARVIKTRN